MSYEDDARADKARRLAAMAYDRARDACFRADEAQGIKPRSAADCADDIMRIADSMGPRHWRAIASTYGVNEPSSKTMALACHEVIERAKRSQNPDRKEAHR